MDLTVFALAFNTEISELSLLRDFQLNNYVDEKFKLNREPLLNNEENQAVSSQVGQLACQVASTWIALNGTNPFLRSFPYG